MALVLDPTVEEYIRLMAGDACESGIVSPTMMQTFWNLTDVQASCNPEAALIVKVLLARWGAAKAAISGVTTGTRVSTANADQIKKQLDYWLGEACMGGAHIQTDEVDLDLTTPVEGVLHSREWQALY